MRISTDILTTVMMKMRTPIAKKICITPTSLLNPGRDMNRKVVGDVANSSSANGNSTVVTDLTNIIKGGTSIFALAASECFFVLSKSG